MRNGSKAQITGLVGGLVGSQLLDSALLGYGIGLVAGTTLFVKEPDEFSSRLLLAFTDPMADIGDVMNKRNNGQS